MTDAQYWHRKAVDQLAEARTELTRARAEVEHYAERCREHQDRTEQAEAESRDVARALVDLSNKAAQARRERDHWYARAQQAGLPDAGYLPCDRDAWKDRAETAEQDLVSTSEQLVDAQDEAGQWKHRARVAEQRSERAERVAEGLDQDLYRTAERAGTWWETAKSLCRQLNDARCDRKLLRHLVEDAERARATAHAEVGRLAGADERAGCNWHDMNRVWRRNRLALSVLAQRPYDHATAELAARVLDGTFTESEVNHATD